MLPLDDVGGDVFFVTPRMGLHLVSHGLRSTGERMTFDLAFRIVLGGDAGIPRIPYIDFAFRIPRPAGSEVGGRPPRHSTPSVSARCARDSSRS